MNKKSETIDTLGQGRMLLLRKHKQEQDKIKLAFAESVLAEFNAGKATDLHRYAAKLRVDLAITEIDLADLLNAIDQLEAKLDKNQKDLIKSMFD